MCPSGSRASRWKPEVESDFQQAFDILDTDRDGKISQDDLRSFYSVHSGAKIANDADIRYMISMADSNEDGFVEIDEFERVLDCGRSSQVNGGVMEDVFKVMDRDGDGKVGFDDLRSYMRWAGLSVNDEDIMSMIQLGGGNEKQGISYEGLLKILAVDSSVDHSSI